MTKLSFNLLSSFAFNFFLLIISYFDGTIVGTQVVKALKFDSYNDYLILT